jgi:hypothetical protein
MKYLVETTGQFHLYDVDARVKIRHEGLTVVAANSGFTERHTSNGNLRIVEQLTDEATDAEWVKWLAASDGNLALAQASFVSKFTVHPAKLVVEATDSEAEKPVEA